MSEGPSAAVRQLPAEIYEGAVLAGRYRVGRMLGAGGMGAVFAAEHVELREPVAIKVLLRDVTTAGSSEALTRFEREAWAASRIKSEYVARVNDVGRLENGTPFIVMEYLDGVDLSDLLESSGPLEVTQAVELMLQACEALAEAHALGIFHRDLKPSNLFCVTRSDGLLAIKLLDFGISKVAVGPAGDARLTTTAATLGTPLYMSPEQMRSGRSADERSDVWALGVILYELLSGKVPFSAENVPELAVMIAMDAPRPLRELRKALPAPLERAVARCLAKDPAERFPNVAELARALAPFGPPRASEHAERAQRILDASRARSSPTLRALKGLGGTGPGSHARLRGLATTTRAPGKPGRLLVVSLVVLAAAVLLLVGWWLRSPAPAAERGTVQPRPREVAASPPPPSAAPIDPDELTPSAADDLGRARANAAEAPSVADPKPPSTPRSVEAVPPTASTRPQPKAAPGASAPTAKAKPNPPTVPDDEPRRSQTKRASRPAPEPAAPAARGGKDSELESLGGRL